MGQIQHLVLFQEIYDIAFNYSARGFCEQHIYHDIAAAALHKVMNELKIDSGRHKKA